MSSPARVPLPLCRLDGHTCGACCWGEAVGRFQLRAQLRRQTRLFQRCLQSSCLPGRGPLLLYELAARRSLDLALALLLWLPGVGNWFRPWLKRRMVCAFLGFEDEALERVGCMIHPSRWHGEDVRPRVAFGLLAGFACGPPDDYCLAAHWFAGARWDEKRDFARSTTGMGWYQFSRTVRAFRPGGNRARRRRAQTASPDDNAAR